MFLLLPVDSHDLSSTSIFWHEMNHEGFSTCQAAKPPNVSEALLRNASLRQKASEQGHVGGTDGIPNLGGSACATNENSWGHLSTT